MTQSEKKLYLQKLTISNDLINNCIKTAKIPTNQEVDIAVVDFNTPKVCNYIQKRFPMAKVHLVDNKQYNLYNVQGKYYTTEEEKIKMLNDITKNGELYIMANFPYGDKLGSAMTKKIIDEVDYKTFVNLLPGYKYLEIDNLWQHIYLDTVINTGYSFEDATVIPSIAKISKTKVNDLSGVEFTINCFTDESIKKYCFNNLTRKLMVEVDKSGKKALQWSLATTVLFGWRDATAKSMPLSIKNDQHQWNLGLLDKQEFIDRRNRPRAKKTNSYELCFYAYDFKTKQEKDNFVKFIYSDDGFRFMAKLFTAMNTSSYVELSPYLPRVDWTREWTVEEILVDYEYTQDEIKEVINDLSNYKGLSR